MQPPTRPSANPPRRTTERPGRMGRGKRSKRREQQALLLHRLYFQHFTTSRLAERADGSLAAFLIGFGSQTDPPVAHIRFVRVDPALQGPGDRARPVRMVLRESADLGRRASRLHHKPRLLRLASPSATDSNAWGSRVRERQLRSPQLRPTAQRGSRRFDHRDTSRASPESSILRVRKPRRRQLRRWTGTRPRPRRDPCPAKAERNVVTSHSPTVRSGDGTVSKASTAPGAPSRLTQRRRSSSRASAS